MKNMYTSVLSRWLMLLLLLNSQTLLAQTAPTIQWQRFYSGPAKQAPNGDYLVAGGNVIRLASDGTQKWSKSLATYSAVDLVLLSDGTSVVLARDGNYYYKWALIQIDAAGTILWTKPFADYTSPNGGYPQRTPTTIIQSTDAGFVVLGSISYGRNGSGTELYKFDNTGSLTKQPGVSYTNEFPPSSVANQIIPTRDGGYLIVGRTGGAPVTDDKGIVIANLRGWAVKLNANMDQVWTDRYDFAGGFSDVIASPFNADAFIAAGSSPDGKATVTLVISPTNSNVNNTGGTSRPKLSYTTLTNYPYQGSTTTVSSTIRIVSSNATSFEVVDGVDQRAGDIRIASFGAANQTRWTKILGGTAADVVNNAITTQDGGYLLSGLTQSNDGDIQGNTPNNVSSWLVKLAPSTPLTLAQPSYDCDRGSITFITTGGDGSSITYSAPGVSRQSATSNTGFVEQGLRNDPKPITITATQSGYSTSYVFDFKAYCTGLITPTLKEPIPDQSRPVNVQIISNIIPINSYFNGVPSFKSFRPIVNYRADGLPPGLLLFDSSNQSQQLAYIGGTPTTTGTYSVTITAYVSNAVDPQPSVSTTFRITITDNQVITPPPSGGTLTLTQPTYDCSTGAITFNTAGGNGSTITYTAPGIARSSVTSNMGTVEQGLRNDPKTITITATQSGYSASYSFDLKAACSGTTPTTPTTPTPPPTTGGMLTLTQPTYECSTGVITFNSTGGDGSTIVYSAPGITRSSVTSNTGTVEQGLRNDPKVITITATQSGQTTTYSFDLKAFCNGTPPTPSSTLKLLVPVVDCSSRQVTLVTSGGDGSTITFNTPTITRSSATSPTGTVDFCVGAQPPVLQATQSGFTTTYEGFDFAKQCPAFLSVKPLMASQIPDITLPGPDYRVTLGNYFRTETNPINRYAPSFKFQLSGAPGGSSIDDQSSVVRSLQPHAFLTLNISTPGVYTVTVTGRNECEPAASSTFKVTVNPTSGTIPLTLTQPTYDCSTGAFTFNFTGGNGSPVEFQAAGITGWTTNRNQFVDKDSRTASDVKPFMLMARQNGQMVTYTWDLKAACGRSARMAAAEAGQALELTVKGNPVGNTAVVEIRGAEGQAIQLDLLNASGHVLEQRHIEQVGAVDEQRFDLQRQPTGLLFLRAQSGQQKQTVKLIKQ